MHYSTRRAQPLRGGLSPSTPAGVPAKRSGWSLSLFLTFASLTAALVPAAIAQEATVQELKRGRPAPAEAPAAVQPPPAETLVIVSPLNSKFVFLIDANGRVLHEWKFEVPGSNAYLFPDGSLMRASQEPEIDLFDGRGSAGRIQKLDWEGNLVWDFKYATPEHLHHHDFELLPNGNVLLIAWEKLSREEALAAGRDPEKLEVDELYSEKIVEIKPEGRTGGREVWKWRLWDHLVQSFDESLPNYGSPAESPQRVNLNYIKTPRADWIHMNAVDYNADLDQIIMSARYFDELWVIDHSTTMAEAATSTGGRSGHGGDLLYRMGNPMAYSHGNMEDKMLFGQHDCRWILDGYPGAGDVTVFNNGTSPPRTGFSSADQFQLPIEKDGSYRQLASGRFEPPQLVWQYERGSEMYSHRISGTERLRSGNTLICSGDQPWILEISPDKKVVWDTQQHYGGGPEDSDNYDNGAMFRAPGYDPDFLEPQIREQLGL